MNKGMRGTHLLERNIHVGPFKGPGKLLWVCATAVLAEQKWEHGFDSPETIRMGYPGMGIVGEQFDEIILDDIYAGLENHPPETRKIMRARIEQWVYALRTRVHSHGQIRKLVKVRKIYER